MRRAAEVFERLAAEYPAQEPWAERARESAAALRRALPGQPLPDLRSEEWTPRDAENQELSLAGYRGRVLMLDAFDGETAEYAALVPLRRALRDRLKGRPFDLVGLCSRPTTIRAWSESARRLGVDWRIGLLQGAANPVYWQLQIRRPISTILVDAQGVIRARDLAWEELVRRAEELVAEAESGAKPASPPR
jgi:hypothetical protein